MKRYFHIFLIFMLIVSYPCLGQAKGTERGKLEAHYSHPISGVVEDAGNNPGIGQGMVESMVDSEAFIEEIESEWYLSFRFHLANEISNESFSIQKGGEGKFVEVPYEIPSQDQETKDYRIKIPSKDIIVRSSVYVNQMGRPVVFYFALSNFQKEPTNSIGREGEEGTKQSENTGQGQDQEKGPMAQNANKIGGKNSLVLPTKASGDKAINPQDTNKAIGGKVPSDHGLLLSGSEELAPFLQMDLSNSEETQVDEGGKTSLKDLRPSKGYGEVIIKAFLIMLVVSSFIFFFMAMGLYLYGKKLRMDNKILEDKIYEKD